MSLVLQQQAKERKIHILETDVSWSLEKLHTKLATLVRKLRGRLAKHIKNGKIELVDIARSLEEYLRVGDLTDEVSVDKLFNRIQGYYYCLNCSVINYIFQEFLTKNDDTDLLEEMKEYLSNLECFKSTKLLDLQSAIHKALPPINNQTIIETTCEVVLKFKGQWENQTINTLESFLKHYFNRNDLFNYVQVERGCICVTFLVPHSYYQYLIDKATPMIKSMYRVGLFKLIINGNVLLDEKDGVNIGESLVEAAKSGDTFEVAMLLLLGANPYYKDSNENSAMSLALLEKNEEVTKLLVYDEFVAIKDVKPKGKSDKKNQCKS